MPVVLVEKKTPQITVITLNRPERRNALSIQLLTELMEPPLPVGPASCRPVITLWPQNERKSVILKRGAGSSLDWS